MSSAGLPRRPVNAAVSGVVIGGNRYDRSELAGAFGDLGTLIPFVVGYITISQLDPQGVLLGFGLLAVLTGLYFRTPMSVQPMKAIATVAVTHPGVVTPGGIFVSAVITGCSGSGWALRARCPGSPQSRRDPSFGASRWDSA